MGHAARRRSAGLRAGADRQPPHQEPRAARAAGAAVRGSSARRRRAADDPGGPPRRGADSRRPGSAADGDRGPLLDPRSRGRPRLRRPPAGPVRPRGRPDARDHAGVLREAADDRRLEGPDQRPAPRREFRRGHGTATGPRPARRDRRPGTAHGDGVPGADHAAVHRRHDRARGDRGPHDREPDPPPDGQRPVDAGRVQERDRRLAAGGDRRHAGGPHAAQFPGHRQRGGHLRGLLHGQSLGRAHVAGRPQRLELRARGAPRGPPAPRGGGPAGLCDRRLQPRQLRQGPSPAVDRVAGRARAADRRGPVDRGDDAREQHQPRQPARGGRPLRAGLRRVDHRRVHRLGGDRNAHARGPRPASLTR